jgi:hypothetical protein
LRYLLIQFHSPRVISPGGNEIILHIHNHQPPAIEIGYNVMLRQAITPGLILHIL